MIADALHRLRDKWRTATEREPTLTPAGHGWVAGYDAGRANCADDLDAVLATVRETPQTPLKLCAGGTHTWTRTTSRWPGPAERCDCGVRTWGVQQAEGRAPEPPKGTLSNEDAKHSCPRCEMDLLDCVCPEPAEARVPHEPPGFKDVLVIFDDWRRGLPHGAFTHPDGLRFVRAIKRLEAEAHEARPAQPLDWQPMATAPKDGSAILVYFTSIGIHRVFWSDAPFGPGIGCWCVTDNKNEDMPLRGYVEKDATGWMPLPDPPAAVPQPIQESK